MNNPTVGRSERTPNKHLMLNSELGRIVGCLGNRDSFKTISSQIPIPKRFAAIDLCAGDGVDIGDDLSSPTIIMKHIQWLRERWLRENVGAVFIEKKQITFNKLQSSLADKDCLLLNMDASEYVFPKHVTDNSTVFVNYDPNHMNVLAMSENFIRSLPVYSTFMVTMGCNVAGIKRIELSERKNWFEFIAFLEETLTDNHDIVLVETVKDCANWGYLFRVPTAWSPETQRKLLTRGSKLFKNGVLVSSLRYSWRSYKESLNRLFLTKEERGNL